MDGTIDKITRLACNFNPASISIEYSNGTKRLQYRQFPVVFGSFSDSEVLFNTLLSDYGDFFNQNTISLNKLKKFVQIIIKKAPTIDLSKVAQSDQTVYLKYKTQMNREFESNVIKPGDPNYQYDMRVEIEATEPCDWDDE